MVSQGLFFGFVSNICVDVFHSAFRHNSETVRGESLCVVGKGSSRIRVTQEIVIGSYVVISSDVYCRVPL